MTTPRKKLRPEQAVSLASNMLVNPMTYDEIVEFTGLNKATVEWWVKRWRDSKLVYVSGYADDSRGRPVILRFSWGSLLDAVRPGQRRTAAERMRDVRARRAAEKKGGAV
jgi:hypothetical protein